MYNDLKIGTKVLAAFLFIAIITAGFTGYFAFSYGKTFLERESFNKLTAVREMKAGQIEDYFKQIFFIRTASQKLWIQQKRYFQKSV